MSLRFLATLAITMTASSVLFVGAARAQDASLEALASTARNQSHDAGAQTAYGRALIQAGDYREAERVLRLAARLQRDSLPALFDVARVAFAQNDYRAARRACRALEREERDAALTHVCRARAFLVWNRSGRAFAELEAAASSGPAFETNLALGDAYRLRADVENAEQAYRRAIAEEPQSAEPHAGLGLLYLAARRNDDAVRSLRAALERDPNDPEVNLALGKLLGGEEGRSLITRSVLRRPRHPGGQVALGEAALARGDLDAASAAFAAALEIDPQRAPAHAGAGRVALAQGDLALAETELRRALELVPNDATVVLALGRLSERQDNDREAFQAYRHAADLDPSNPAGLLAAAELALRQDRDVLATAYLDRLLQRHANLPAALALYGDALAARHDRNGARRMYERALAAEGELDRDAIRTRMNALGGEHAAQQGSAIAPH